MLCALCRGIKELLLCYNSAVKPSLPEQPPLPLQRSTQLLTHCDTVSSLCSPNLPTPYRTDRPENQSAIFSFAASCRAGLCTLQFSHTAFTKQTDFRKYLKKVIDLVISAVKLSLLRLIFNFHNKNYLISSSIGK